FYFIFIVSKRGYGVKFDTLIKRLVLRHYKRLFIVIFIFILFSLNNVRL
ncbi:MAG: hypothetical protein ACD_26C00152G0001, partial [uncultured bacterium]